jgi:hypothetical protein
MNNSFDYLNRLDTAEKRINEPENKSIEASQPEMQNENNLFSVFPFKKKQNRISKKL